MRERRAVRPRRGHRVERVGDGEQARLDRDRVAAQPRGVAVAVPALVMEEDVRQRVARSAERADELRARARVGADLGELVERQRAGLAQEVAADGDLADVVDAALRSGAPRCVPPPSRAGARRARRGPRPALRDPASGRAPRARGRWPPACPKWVPHAGGDSSRGCFSPAGACRNGGRTAADDEHRDAGGRVQAVRLDRVGGRLARRSTRRGRPRRPDDPAGRIPEEEPPPLHLAEPGDPGGREAQDRDEAAEEHRLRRRAAP